MPYIAALGFLNPALLIPYYPTSKKDMNHMKFEFDAIPLPKTITGRLEGTTASLCVGLEDVYQSVLEELAEEFKQRIIQRGKPDPVEKDDSPIGKLLQDAYDKQIDQLKKSENKKAAYWNPIQDFAFGKEDIIHLNPPMDIISASVEEKDNAAPVVRPMPNEVVKFDPCPKCGCKHIPGSSFCDGDEKALYEKNKKLQSTETTSHPVYLFLGGAYEGKRFHVPNGMNHIKMGSDTYWRIRLTHSSRHVFATEDLSANDCIDLLIKGYKESSPTPQPSSPTPALPKHPTFICTQCWECLITHTPDGNNLKCPSPPEKWEENKKRVVDKISS